jgi:hypothetical protein
MVARLGQLVLTNDRESGGSCRDNGAGDWRSQAFAHKAWVDRSSWSSGTRRRYPSPISASIQLYARFRFAAFPTSDRPSRRCGAFCVQVAVSLLSNTCAVQTPSYADLSACSTPIRCVRRQITCYVSQSKPCRRQVLASTISNGRNWASSSA